MKDIVRTGRTVFFDKDGKEILPGREYPKKIQTAPGTKTPAPPDKTAKKED